MPEALRNAGFHRIDADSEHDRNLDAGDHHRMQRQASLRDDDVGLGMNERVDLLRNPGLRALAPPHIDDEIIALGVSELTHAVAKRFEIG